MILIIKIFQEDGNDHLSLIVQQVMQLQMKVDNSKSEQSTKLKTVRGEQQHELQILDFK